MNLNTRRWTAAGAVLGTLALIGTGVSSSFTDGATAVVNQSVGQFACTLSSTDPLAQISTDKHTITVNMPAITSSTSGNVYTNFTLTNAGTIPAAVSWTVTPGGTITFQPTGRMGYTNPTVNGTLLAGASQSYANVGFQWAALINADLSKTASVSYTANCGEVPAAPASNISFVGVTNGVPTAAPSTAVASGSNYWWTATGPSGQVAWSQNGGVGLVNVASTASFPASGTITVVTTLGVAPTGSPATISYTGKTATSFTGATTISGGGMLSTGNSIIGAAPPGLALPAGAKAGDMALVTTTGTNSNRSGTPSGYTSLDNNFGSDYASLSYKVLTSGETSVPPTLGNAEQVAVYRGVASIGANTAEWGYSYDTIQVLPLTLANSNGTSWVVGLAHDAALSANGLQAMTLAGLTSRNAGLAVATTGLWDTNAGVASWAGVVGHDTNYAVYSSCFTVELKSA